LTKIQSLVINFRSSLLKTWLIIICDMVFFIPFKQFTFIFIKYQIHRIINKSFVYRYFFIYTFIETNKNFHHVWKCVNYIFDCHVYRLRFVRYVLDVFVCFNEGINKEISIHKTFIYYSMNLIFNKNECELFIRNEKNHITNYYQSRFQ
jgi:hypothetical protein